MMDINKLPTPKEVFDSANDVLERFKAKLNALEELDLSIEDIVFIENKIKFIQDFLVSYSKQFDVK